MKRDFDYSKEGLRSQQRAKRRKTNLILNASIGIVIILIILVSVSIFSGNDEKQGATKGQITETKTNSSDKGEEKSEPKSLQTSAVQKGETDLDKSKTDVEKKDVSKADKKKKDDEQADLDDSQIISEGGGENVKKTIINPDWESLGTNQTQAFSSESVDWDERVRALAYAIGTDQGNMTVWYMGRAGEKQSIGTVSAKGNDQAYRVYLEWKDDEGWTPVKVEELIENDKR